jgi:2-iminobutanoate/2-iminopropanoate deaminase
MMRAAILLITTTVALAGCATLHPAVRHINSDKIAQLGPYSHAVAAGEFVFISGMIAHDKDTGFAAPEIAAQTHQAFTNLTAALEAAGLTLGDVVKTVVYLKNPADFPALNEVYATYFSESPPARTTVPGVDWGRDDILVEIEAIALRR